MRRAITIVAAVIIIAALAAAGLTLSQHSAAYTPMSASVITTRYLMEPFPGNAPAAHQLALGQYLVRAGDCSSCHSRSGGRFLAGGYRLNTPFGVIYSTNLTPDTDTGIGRWTPDMFYAALHDGTGGHGENLYPAMPYPYTTRMTRQDSDAILAFLRTLPPVRVEQPVNELPFPFNVRALVKGWNLLFFSRGEFQPDPAKPTEWNRGAYLVTGPGHCGACHTPKNALGGDHMDQPLHGGVLNNWTAPDLTANTRTGLGSWSAEEIVEYLKTGRNAHANAGGGMAEVVSYSTSLLNDADLRAIAVYLKDRPAKVDDSPDPAEPGAMKRGAAIFSDACTGCHMEKGVGQARLFPPLKGSAVAQQSDPTGLLHILLGGDRTAATLSRPSPLTMPSFAWKLSDKQLADVANFVRNSWGNRAQPVTIRQVADLRQGLRLETGRPVEAAAAQ